jgi:hypothetical protein
MAPFGGGGNLTQNVFPLSLQIYLKHLSFSAIYYHKRKVFMESIRYSLSDFNKTSIFSTDFQKKNPQISNFMKICPVGAELFHPERQTNGHDMTRHISFHVLCNPSLTIKYQGE